MLLYSYLPYACKFWGAYIRGGGAYIRGGGGLIYGLLRYAKIPDKTKAPILLSKEDR